MSSSATDSPPTTTQAGVTASRHPVSRLSIQQ
jgi:hypothetical protein